MIFKIRQLLWKILGIDYNQALNIHDYVFLKKDIFSTIGKNTYDNGAIVFRWSQAPLTIGKYCSIANNVRFIIDEGYHCGSQITSYPLINNLYKNISDDTDRNRIKENIKQKQGITIGNDVWIGMGAYIMPGITIGNGATIAANSVVTKDVLDYTIVGGSPAKLIKSKLDIKQVNAMNKIAWWNWDEEVIKEKMNDFYNLNHENFIQKYIK